MLNDGLLPCRKEGSQESFFIKCHQTASQTLAPKRWQIALAAADTADRPTLEHLHLNRHPGIGVGTGVALAAAPAQLEQAQRDSWRCVAAGSCMACLQHLSS